ncbi:MAG: hypothetical protein KJ811_03110 [Candidatus Margulisbacteria bacterium]|nr:hypothetical protein [Candidatus Margulisiibacteriota bacterium]
MQLRYVISATMITGSVDICFNLILILLGNYKLIWVGPYSSFVWVSILAYAITKHRLMNIAVVISKAMAHIITTIFLAAVYLIFTYSYITLVSAKIGLAFIAISVLYGLLVGEVFQLVRTRVQTATDRAFIKGWYDYRKVQREASSGLAKAMSRSEIIDAIYPTLNNEVDAQGIHLFFLDKETDRLVEIDAETKSPLPSSFLDKQSKFLDKLLSKRDIVFMDKSDPIEGRLCIPAFSDHHIIACIVLGRKRSEDEYSEDDLALFRTVKEGIENALEYKIKPYEEVKQKLIEAQVQL